MNDTQTLHGLDDVLRKLKSLPPALVSKRGGPVGAALRKGGNVIRKEWQDQVQRIIDEPNVRHDGIDAERSTGLLKKSIVVRRDGKPWRSGASERYIVRISNKKYPNATGRKPVTTAQVGRLLETGTEKRQPMPWATPGYMAKRQEALNTIVRELNAGIAKAIRKMERS